ncbi:hypothetical protein [Paenibacillus sp. Soil787]|uniref:hypothetical protein n=1 Tax=Paenibacillus sp. Soil787 TaxID=1736411 RepID=UPI000702560A|nr:hypothetical protein [Paenibacillus sp. Soil787]KRF13610.1 hypothetical protein ASG93_13925 [Paenibacillus sp. Soil787]
MKTLIVDRTEVIVGSLNMAVVHLHQKDIGIIVREELGHILLIDTKDCSEMFIMSSLFKHVSDTNDVLFLQRESPSHADLFIFNGAINPLNKKIIKEIKLALKNIKSKKFELKLINNHDESIWDKWENWKYEEQLRIQSDHYLAILNASKLGFELLTHQCAYLASSYSGHAHFDWNSTSTSIELIIRNIARNT